MLGRTPGKTGGVFAGIRCGFFLAENAADGRRSFAAAEWPMSDRLLTPMEEQEPVQVVELRVSYRYASAHPWVVQAIGGFLSAYFMEYPGFRVQRHIEDLESGTHQWICEVPPAMKVLRLLKRLKEDIPPCHAQEIATDPPMRPRYLIDCPE